MAKTNSKRKTHTDKFPLTLHKTGQYCKKIKGKLSYFGTDKKAALNRYLDQAAYLHANKRPRLKTSGNTLSIKTLCKLYLDHQVSRSEIKEMKLRHLYDQTSLLRDFVRFVSPNRTV